MTPREFSGRNRTLALGLESRESYGRIRASHEEPVINGEDLAGTNVVAQVDHFNAGYFQSSAIPIHARRWQGIQPTHTIVDLLCRPVKIDAALRTRKHRGVGDSLRGLVRRLDLSAIQFAQCAQ